MRRIRLPLGRVAFFMCALVFCLLALLPLRFAIDWMALDRKGMAAREAQGSIWLGSLHEAQFGPVRLGDLQAQMRTLPLLLGQARVDLRRRSDVDRFTGSVAVARQGMGLNDVTGDLDIAALLAPLPISRLNLNDLSVRYADGLCASADGQVKATVAGDIAGLTLPDGLSGKPRCDGGALFLPLTSQSGMETLNVRLFEDGRYEVELQVRPTNPAIAARLTASGFAPSAGGAYAIRKAGDFRPPLPRRNGI